MKYLKSAWKLSGSLKLQQYCTIATIIWTVILPIVFFEMIKTTITQYFSFENLVIDVLTICIFVVFWYLNARFNPFCFDDFKIHLKKDINEAVKNTKQAYKTEKVKGPITAEEKINPFGGDYTGSYTGVGGTYLKNVGSKENPEYAGPTVVHGKVNLNYNWTTKTESSFDVVYRAFSEGLAEGVISLLGMFIMKPMAATMFWPISCIIGWVTIGKYIERNEI